MSKKETIEEKTWELLAEPCASLGLLPVDAEYVREKQDYSLLIYIDKEGGVTIDDCEALSRLLDPLLDEADFIPDAYTMIVSSPGLGRIIKRPRDFVFAQGKEVDVKLFQPLQGEKEWNGILVSYDKESVTLKTENGERTISRSGIAQIRLTVHF